MKGTPKKGLLAAIILYVGSFMSAYIAQLPQQPIDGFTISDPNWSVWNYLSLLVLMCAVGLTIAGIKLRR